MDEDHHQLFPKHYTNNHKITYNISFDKMVGRAEQGINLQKRKVKRKATEILLNKIHEEKKHLEKVRSISPSKSFTRIDNKTNYSAYGAVNNPLGKLSRSSLDFSSQTTFYDKKNTVDNRKTQFENKRNYSLQKLERLSPLKEKSELDFNFSN
jgi:hypothetical protein